MIQFSRKFYSEVWSDVPVRVTRTLETHRHVKLQKKAEYSIEIKSNPHPTDKEMETQKV